MQPKYNILLVHNKYQFAGGEDTVVAQDASLLQSHGHKVFLYERNNEEIKYYNKLQKLLLPFQTIYSFKTVHDIRSLIKENHIDIVHVHNTLPLISLSVYYAAKKEHCTLVQTLHNFRFVCPNGVFFRDGQICEDCLQKGLQCSVKHRCYRDSSVQTLLVAVMTKFHRLKRTFHKPDAYISLTPFQKSKFTDYLPSDRIYVKPNYLAEPLLKDDINPLPYSEHPFYLYVGRIEQVKGSFVLLQAFEQMPDKQLVMLGSGPDDEKVANYIKTHNLTNIHQLGFTPHDTVLQYQKKAQAFILPSLLYEGFPMGIVESFSLGTPVIASNTPNIASIMKDEIHGFLFEVGNHVSLIQKIKRFESFDRDKLSSNVRQQYLQDYTPETGYNNLMNIYQSVNINQQR